MQKLQVKFQSDADNTVLYSVWLSITINTVKCLDSEAQQIKSVSQQNKNLTNVTSQPSHH